MVEFLDWTHCVDDELNLVITQIMSLSVAHQWPLDVAVCWFFVQLILVLTVTNAGVNWCGCWCGADDVAFLTEVAVFGC